MKIVFKKVLPAICILAFLGCEATVKPTVITALPAQNYEKIIYLRTWSPSALDPTLGLIYVLPGKNITTNYPYKREIRSEDELTWREKVNFPGMKIVEIKNKAGEVQGYVRILGPVTVNPYQRDNGIVVQLDVPKELGEFPVPAVPGPGSSPTPR